MKISAKGLAMIEGFEGCLLKAGWRMDDWLWPDRQLLWQKGGQGHDHDEGSGTRLAA